MPQILPQQQTFYRNSLARVMAPLLKSGLAQLYFNAAKRKYDEGEIQRSETITNAYAEFQVLESKYKTGSKKHRELVRNRDQRIRIADAVFKATSLEIHSRNQTILGLPIQESVTRFSEAATINAANTLALSLNALNDTIINFIIPDPAAYASKKGIALSDVIGDLFSSLESLSAYIDSDAFKTLLAEVKSDVGYVLEAKMEGQKFDSIHKNPVVVGKGHTYANGIHKYPRVAAIGFNENFNQATTALHPTPDPYKSGDFKAFSKEDRKAAIDAKKAVIQIRKNIFGNFARVLVELNTPMDKAHKISELLVNVLNLITSIVYNPESYSQRFGIIDQNMMQAMMIVDDCFNPMPAHLIIQKNNLINSIDSFRSKLLFRDMIVSIYPAFPLDPTIESSIMGMIEALSKAGKILEAMILDNKTDSRVMYDAIHSNFTTFEALLDTLRAKHSEACDYVLTNFTYLKMQIVGKFTIVEARPTPVAVIIPTQPASGDSGFSSPAAGSSQANSGRTTPVADPDAPAIHSPKARKAAVAAAAPAPLERHTASPAPASS